MTTVTFAHTNPLDTDALLCLLVFQDMDQVALIPRPDVHIMIKPSFKLRMYFLTFLLLDYHIIIKLICVFSFIML